MRKRSKGELYKQAHSFARVNSIYAGAASADIRDVYQFSLSDFHSDKSSENFCFHFVGKKKSFWSDFINSPAFCLFVLEL